MAIQQTLQGLTTAGRFQQDTPRSKLSWWKPRTRTSTWNTLEEMVRRIYETQATPLYYGASSTSSSLGDKRRLVHHLLRLRHLLLRLLHRLLLRLLHRLLLKLLVRHLRSQGPPKLHRLPAQGQRRRRKLTPPETSSRRTIARKRSLNLMWQQKSRGN